MAIASPSTQQVLEKYLLVLEDVNGEPAISLKSFVLLYGKLLLWELSLLLTPLVLIVNGCIYVWNKTRGQKRSYFGYLSFTLTSQGFKSLQDGDVPLMKFLTLRFVTSLFVEYHIRSRAEKLLSELRNRELKLLLAKPAATDLASVHTQVKMITKLRSNLRSRTRIEFGFLIFLAPYLPEVLKILTEHVAKGTESLSAALISLKHSVLFGEYSIVFVSFFIYGLWIFVSSFIRQRELMNKHGVYICERQLFKTLAARPGWEFPLDLIGYCLFLLFTPAFVLIQQLSAHRFPHRFLLNNMIVSLLFTIPFLYALYRRARRQNW
jgi:hypothetical protein